MLSKMLVQLESLKRNNYRRKWLSSANSLQTLRLRAERNKDLKITRCLLSSLNLTAKMMSMKSNSLACNRLLKEREDSSRLTRPQDQEDSAVIRQRKISGNRHKENNEFRVR